ncbi:diacylglycerol/lipid kinase family protein [Roseobacteraceae bacterium NS-SX3]
MIVNPRSGQTASAAWQQHASGALSSRGVPAALRVVQQGENVEQVTRHALAAGYRRFAVAGGDGTVSAAARALAGTGAVLGLLPSGTFDFFARGHGIPASFEAAAEVIRQGSVKAVPVGEINGTVFLNNVSFGIYPEILNRREGLYRRWGRSRLAAYWSVLASLGNVFRLLRIRVIAEGKEAVYRTPLAFAVQNQYQLHAYDLAEGLIRPGQLALYVIKAKTPLALMASALRLARRAAEWQRDFDLICADQIVVKTRPGTRLVACDGERLAIKGPYRLTVRPDALKLLVPAETGERA